MRDEERRYDEASQLCRAADDLRERIGSLRRRLDGRGEDELSRAELEAAHEGARSALEHLRRYRERVVGGPAREEVGAG